MKWILQKADGEILMTHDTLTNTYTLPTGESITQQEVSRRETSWPSKEFWITQEPTTRWVKADHLL